MGGFFLFCFFWWPKPLIFHHLFPIFRDFSSGKSLCHWQSVVLRRLFHRLSLLMIYRSWWCSFFFRCCCCVERKGECEGEGECECEIQARRQQHERPDDPCLRTTATLVVVEGKSSYLDTYIWSLNVGPRLGWSRVVEINALSATKGMAVPRWALSRVSW